MTDQEQHRGAVVGTHKIDSVHVETVQPNMAGAEPVMRSESDDLTVWQTVKRYKLVTAMTMCAAFCASLDGYQITLNGGIVSNKGFIRQFAGAGVKVIPGKYISAWGGIQSAGQTLGQIVRLSCHLLRSALLTKRQFLQFVTDALGRKPALLVLWVILTAVSISRLRLRC